jgi:MinD-like ATPase involved in chromosome partitioning or flagellar assembly
VGDRRVEPDPTTWWDRYGHRLEPRELTGQAATPHGTQQEQQGGSNGMTAPTGPPYPQQGQPAGPQNPGAPTPGVQNAGPQNPSHQNPDPQNPNPQNANPQGPPGPGLQGAGPLGPPQHSGPQPVVPPMGPPRVSQQGPPLFAPQAAQYGSPPPPPGPKSASELSSESILRARSDEPVGGWRRAVLRMSGGMLNPGPSPEELREREVLHRIRRPLLQSHRIAVTSIKGGVGKTTVSTLLGLVMAENRGDRVIALDANPDAGTLADRLTGESNITVRELLRDLDRINTWTEVSRYTSLAGRLQVLASEQDPAAGDAFSREEYEHICALLDRFFNVIITDSGTGLVHSAMEGTLKLADSLIIVGAPTVDGAGRASKTLDWLLAHGHGALATDAVAVLSCDRTSHEVDLGRIRDHFAARCRAVVEIPHDPHLATGGRVQLSRLRPQTRTAAYELAALMADQFVT